MVTAVCAVSRSSYFCEYDPSVSRQSLLDRLLATLCPTTIGRSCEHTGTATTTLTVPARPSLVAEMVVEPAATAVASPAAETVTRVGSALLHVTMRPASTAPVASTVEAVNCWVPPTTSDAVVGFTTTDATGVGMTVSEATPVRDPALAMIWALPGAIAATTPDALTVATVGALLDHCTTPVAIAALF